MLFTQAGILQAAASDPSPAPSIRCSQVQIACRSQIGNHGFHLAIILAAGFDKADHSHHQSRATAFGLLAECFAQQLGLELTVVHRDFNMSIHRGWLCLSFPILNPLVHQSRKPASSNILPRRLLESIHSSQQDVVTPAHYNLHPRFLDSHKRGMCGPRLHPLPPRWQSAGRCPNRQL